MLNFSLYDLSMNDEEFLRFCKNRDIRKLSDKDSQQLIKLSTRAKSKRAAPVSSTPRMKDRLGTEGKRPKVAVYSETRSAPEYKIPHQSEKQDRKI